MNEYVLRRYVEFNFPPKSLITGTVDVPDGATLYCCDTSLTWHDQSGGKVESVDVSTVCRSGLGIGKTEGNGNRL